MQHVRLRLSAHGREARIHPMYGVLANAAFVERATAIQWNFTGDHLVILHHVEGDIEDFEQVLTHLDVIQEYELEPTSADRFYAYIDDETTGPLRGMFNPIGAGSIVVVPPVIYHEDGSVSMSVFGSDTELQAALATLTAPVDLSVLEVSSLGAIPALAEASLTDRQYEALTAAVEVGYYEIPREASQEDVAAAIGLAPTTAADHLRRAEASLLKSAVRW